MSVFVVVMMTTFSYTTFSTSSTFSFLGRLQTTPKNLHSHPASVRDSVNSRLHTTSSSLPGSQTGESRLTSGKRHFAARTKSVQTDSAGQTGENVSITEDGENLHPNRSSPEEELQGKNKNESSQLEVATNTSSKGNGKGTDRNPKGKSATEGKSTSPKEAPVYSSEEGRRLKLQRALQWAGAPIDKGRPQWQMLDNNLTAFVYSAHYDDVHSPPLVRIVGIAEEFLPFSNVTCHYYGRPEGPSVQSVSGTLYHFRGRNKRR